MKECNAKPPMIIHKRNKFNKEVYFISRCIKNKKRFGKWQKHCFLTFYKEDYYV